MATSTSTAADGIELSEDPADERLVSRTCGWCGELMVYRGVGRRPKYCSKSCKNRAWEVRSAQRRLDRDIAAGTASTEPVREVVSRPPKPEPKAPAPRQAAPRAPVRIADWVKLLAVLEEQLHGELGPKYWDHPKLLKSLNSVLGALDQATPGGLDALMNKRR